MLICQKKLIYSWLPKRTRHTRWTTIDRNMIVKTNEDGCWIEQLIFLIYCFLCLIEILVAFLMASPDDRTWFYGTQIWRLINCLSYSCCKVCMPVKRTPLCETQSFSASCLLTSPFSRVYSGRGGYHSVNNILMPVLVFLKSLLPPHVPLGREHYCFP